jgi:hypothetical protein
MLSKEHVKSKTIKRHSFITRHLESKSGFQVKETAHSFFARRYDD